MNHSKKQKILVVDDEPLNISVVVEILEQEYDLLVATNGEKSLQIVFSDIKPDLILLDIMMPGMDGFEVIQRIKENPVIQDIPIIFLTAKQENESIVRGFNLGAVDYVAKPFQREELLVRIKNTLQIFALKNELNKALQKSQMYAKTVEIQMGLIDKNIIISSTDLEGNITDVSSAFCRISGYTKEQLIGKNHHIVRHAEMPDSKFARLWQTITSGETWHGEIKNRTKKGRFYWIDTMIYPLKNEMNQRIGYTAISHNITDKKRVEELSVTDLLTQLHNRMFLENSFIREIKRSKRYKHSFSVIMIDIDHFKEVNDTHGHDVGDKVLVTIAELLSQNIRNTDILGRWGGEEFIIISPHTTNDEALILAEKLRLCVQEYPFETVGAQSCSFGISEFNFNDEECKEVVKRADDALYQAKREGRNCVVTYTPTL